MNRLLTRVLIGTTAALVLFLPLPALAATATLAPTVELRQVGDLMVPFQSGLPMPIYEPQSRPSVELTDGWRLLRMNLETELSLSRPHPGSHRGPGEGGPGASLPEFDDGKWSSARLPGVANPPPHAGLTGVWYRRRISIPPQWKGKRVLLHCLAANYVADVWVNGPLRRAITKAASRPFSFDITNDLRNDHTPRPARGAGG